MGTIPSITEFEEALVDLNDMESAVNGGTGVTVTTRLGTIYPSFAKAIADLQTDVGSMNETKVTATSSQTAFTVAAYDVSSSDILVFLNGAHLNSGDFVKTDTTTITLNVGAATGDSFTFLAKEPKTSASLAPVNLGIGATPSVSGVKSALTNNGGAIIITNFTNSFAGQQLIVIGNDSGNTTVSDTATIALAGSANFTLGDNDVLHLIAKTTSLWVEISRSNN